MTIGFLISVCCVVYRVHCAYTSNLLFVAFQDEVFLTQNDKRIGIPILFDTGSDKTWLASDIYDPVMDSVRSFKTHLST